MKKPCNHPGCPTLLDAGGYCDRHKASAPKRHALYDRHVRQRDPALAMAARIRNSPRWRAIRRQMLSASPICADPHGKHARQGTTRTATQVHHVEGLATRPDLAFHSSNLLCVCTACHAALEAAARSDCQSAAGGPPAPSSRQPGGDAPAFG